MAVTRRVYLYGIAFVALGMLVTGLAGLLEVVFDVLVRVSGVAPLAMGADLNRQRASFAGALSVLGLVVWLVHWALAERGVRRLGEAGFAERGSAIRKLFLSAVLLVGGLLLILTGARLVGDLFAAAFHALTPASLLAGAVLQPLALALVAGSFWVYFARVARSDRRILPEVGAAATLRRWYVYVLSYVALFVTLFAAEGVLQALWETIAVVPGTIRLGNAGLGLELAPRLGALVAGLAAWAAAWSWSTAWFLAPDGPDAERRSVLRKVYLYLVLVVVVAWTIWNLGRTLYALLHAALLPEHLALGGWGVVRDLGDPLAMALVFGLAWTYHARVVAREAAVAGEDGARARQATIRWFYEYLVALVGLLTLALGLAGTLATLLDLLIQPGAARPTAWWQDRVSLFGTLVLVGLPVWGLYWGRLQREALARQALVRRIYLFLAFALAVLTLLCSGAVALYQTLRLVLGDFWAATNASDLVNAASAAAIAALFLVYHLRVFRGAAATVPPLPPAPLSSNPVAADSPITQPDGVAAPALLLVRALDPAQLAAFTRDVQARVPAGVAVELLPLDPATTERILAVAAERGSSSAGSAE